MDSPDRRDNPNNALVDQQINEEKAEAERKRQEVFNLKMDIARSQSGESWTPQPLGTPNSSMTPRVPDIFKDY